MPSRWLRATIRSNDAVRNLFDEVAFRGESRPDGYMRILKLGPRPGDNACAKIENWRVEYNTERPHSSLRYETPAEVAQRYTQPDNRPASLAQTGS